VFDEVHHLPGPRFALAAEQSIAPYRLGLTATLERADGGHERLTQLVGPVVYTLGIRDLAGAWLAPYRTEVVKVRLSDADRAAYDAAVEEVRAFRTSRGLERGRGGFRQFLREAARSIEGRKALVAFRTSRRLVQRAPEKLEMVGALLARHKGSRCLVFTHDNATAYEISRTFLVPAVTHRTPLDERREWLDAFATGALPVLATSRVLNEGVDLPAAEVAIVVSGTGTPREHVQRLGRILRPAEGKQAVLYELVVAATVVEGTSARRRAHDAYR
jgi:superfamily II DNA or RNA helicase